MRDGQVRRLRHRRRNGRGRHADVAVVDVAVGLELGHDLPGRVDRDREADPDGAVARAARLDLGVDPDHPARAVEQRTAGVAGVDRGVGLDHMIDREPVGGADRPLDSGDDPGGDGVLKPERVADRDRLVADLDARGVAERKRMELGLGRVHLQHREVGRRVAPDDARVDRVLVAELDRHRLRALDHVAVREDVAALVEGEPGAGGRALLLRDVEARDE